MLRAPDWLCLTASNSRGGGGLVLCRGVFSNREISPKSSKQPREVQVKKCRKSGFSPKIEFFFPRRHVGSALHGLKSQSFYLVGFSVRLNEIRVRRQ